MKFNGILQFHGDKVAHESISRHCEWLSQRNTVASFIGFMRISIVLQPIRWFIYRNKSGCKNKTGVGFQSQMSMPLPMQKLRLSPKH